jgi:cell division initiation protein
MLMPLDIVNKKFKKGFKGYNCEEVDRFIEDMVDDYETLYKENIELKDKITILNEGIQHYKTMEHTLQDTLLIAQKTSEDIKNTAYQRSEVIKRESEFEAEEIRNKARLEVQKLTQECEIIKKEYEMFRMKFKAILTSELQILDEPLNFKSVKIDLDDKVEERSERKLSELTQQYLNPIEERLEATTQEEIDQIEEVSN